MSDLIATVDIQDWLENKPTEEEIQRRLAIKMIEDAPIRLVDSLFKIEKKHNENGRDGFTRYKLTIR